MESGTIKELVDLFTLVSLWAMLSILYLLVVSFLPRLISLGTCDSWKSILKSVKYHAQPYLDYYRFGNEVPGSPGFKRWASLLDRKQSFTICSCPHNPDILAITVFKRGVLVKECHYLTLHEWDAQRKKQKLYPIFDC